MSFDAKMRVWHSLLNMPLPRIFEDLSLCKAWRCFLSPRLSAAGFQSENARGSPGERSHRDSSPRHRLAGSLLQKPSAIIGGCLEVGRQGQNPLARPWEPMSGAASTTQEQPTQGFCFLFQEHTKVKDPIACRLAVFA